MKKIRKFLSLLLGLLVMGCSHVQHVETTHPRVFVFTDINIDSGDPDDRQSLIHLLWYANELDICGIVPDRWYAKGLEACLLANEAYAKDYETYGFAQKGYPTAEQIDKLFAKDKEHAIEMFAQAAADNSRELYVLIWGNMEVFGEALRRHPNLSNNIRVITIATDLMTEEERPELPKHWEVTDLPCTQYNWNGFGRNQIFNAPRFKNMWWLEMNWTYQGMFSGNEPVEMFEHLLKYGSLGAHMEEVVENEPWARYFRVGDTPSVLYLIDPDNNFDDPTLGSWAGKYYKPFPIERPNYYADFSGEVEWDYHNPCNTWQNHKAFRDVAKGTLEAQRPQMYQAMIEKLDRLYNIK